MKILITFFFMVFPVVVLAGGHEDRQDTRQRVAYDAIGMLADESKALKSRVRVLETAAPRQASARNGNGGGSRTATAPFADEDMREAFLIREGQDADVAKAAARTRNRADGREALLSTARKGLEREAATIAALEKLEKSQAQTEFVIRRGMGKKFQKLAKDYGF